MNLPLPAQPRHDLGYGFAAPKNFDLDVANGSLLPLLPGSLC